MIKAVNNSNECKDILGTKEELNNELKKLNGLLSPSIFEYLDSLLNLEFSAIKEVADENDRNALYSLYLYKRIAMYNIYSRALYMYENSNKVLKIYTHGVIDQNNLRVYSSSLDGRELYDYDYNVDNSELPYLGSIRITEYIIDNEKKENEIKSLTKELKELSLCSNPNATDVAQFDYQRRIILEKINHLRIGTIPTNKNKRLVNMSNEFYNMLLDDYGLKESDFEHVNCDSSYIVKKSLIKKPNITIEKRINCI